MNTTELLALFRFEASDEEVPYLWSDATIYGYIDEAQKQFCRDSYGIEDARSYVLTLTSGTNWYALNPTILKLRKVVHHTTGDDVPLIAVERMATYGMRFDGAMGPVKALITGLEKRQLRTYPIPTISSTTGVRADETTYALTDTMLLTVGGNVRKYECTGAGTTAAAVPTTYRGATGEVITDGDAEFTRQAPTTVDTVDLHVFRLSADVAAGDDFEIDEQHVSNLLLWVKYRCYDVQDSETYNPKKSTEYFARWNAYCAKALNEQSRLNHTAGVVAYGGL